MKKTLLVTLFVEGIITIVFLSQKNHRYLGFDTKGWLLESSLSMALIFGITAATMFFLKKKYKVTIQKI